MTDSERYRAGDRIADKYELVRKLDQGGMGTVWAARNLDLDVHVALKLLRPELAETHAVERL
ncbi:MAG: serine/threonine protein kinase, partial [Polyangiaceae bacterium]